VFNLGRVELYYTTIVSNTQGVYRGNSGNTRFRNSLLQNRNYLNCDSDGSNSISNDSANLSTDSSCDTVIGDPNLDPLLGPVQVDNLQPTWYFLPLPNSPLIDKGNSCPTYDQRGALRKDTCDIGAVEFGGLLPQVQLPQLMR